MDFKWSFFGLFLRQFPSDPQAMEYQCMIIQCLGRQELLYREICEFLVLMIQIFRL